MLHFIILLGVLVFVHELGHFLVAKACGVKVLKFSIGFGPKLVGFTRGETEYRISVLPLGGYVKMAGDLPGEELPPEEARRGFLAQPPWKRGLIVAAGPAFNLIFPLLVFFFVYVGPHQVHSNQVGDVEPGLPAAEAGLRPGDRIVAVDGESVETFDEVRQAIEPRFDRQVTLTIERRGNRFQVQLNPVKTVEVDPVESVSRGKIGISWAAWPALVGVPPGSPAEAAGLKSFDRLLSINGKPVADEVALNSVLAQVSGELEVKVERARPVELPGVEAQSPSLHTVKLMKQPGEGYAALGVERKELYVYGVLPGSAAEHAGIHPGDKILELNGKPMRSDLLFYSALAESGDKPFTLKWRSGTEVKVGELHQVKVDHPDGLGGTIPGYDLGIRPRVLSSAEVSNAPEMVTRRMGVGEAARASLREVPEATLKTVKGLAALFVGKVSFKSVGGPVMMYQLASKSAEVGNDRFLELMAMISINLGLVNLFPIPILDGFHLLTAFWEGIRRRPIPTRSREIANMVGLAMLLIIMVLALKNDVTRLIR